MPRQVPNWMIEAYLGDKKVQSGSPMKSGKRRSVLAREEVKEGRKQPGMKNPRGGRYIQQTAPEQVVTGPGESSREFIEDRFADMIIHKEKRDRELDLESYIAELEEEEAKKQASSRTKANNNEPNRDVEAQSLLNRLRKRVEGK